MSEKQKVAEVYADAQLEPGKEFFQRRFLEREGLWKPGDSLAAQASWRLIDPEGQVGMEVAVVSVNNRLMQVPLTYRPSPLPDAAGLLGEMEHSVLGTRYIYDARRDPAFRAALREIVRRGGQPAAKRNLRTGELVLPQVEFRVIPGDETEVVIQIGEANDAVPGTIVGTWGEGEPRRSAVVARPR